MYGNHMQHGPGKIAVLLPAALILLAAVQASAQPASERTVVQAVVDADLAANRILIRWLQVEGVERRFTHYDVLRRAADETTDVADDPSKLMKSFSRFG